VDGIGGDDVVVEVGNDARPVSGPRADHVRLVFMFGLAESGDTIESRWDWIEATLEGPDGAAWAIETADPRGPASIDIEQDRLRLIADVPETLVQQWRGGPVTLSGFAYLTVFGAARPETFTLSTEPVRMPEGVECALPSYGFLLTGFSCRRPHRGPTALLTHTNPPFSMDSFSRGFPYPLPTGTSPFPSGLFPNRIWESGAGASFQAINLETFDPRAYYAEGTEVTIIYRERLGFLRETFEFSIDLDDFLRE
jgi:hypothetical protein